MGGGWLASLSSKMAVSPRTADSSSTSIVRSSVLHMQTALGREEVIKTPQLVIFTLKFELLFETTPQVNRLPSGRLPEPPSNNADRRGAPHPSPPIDLLTPFFTLLIVKHLICENSSSWQGGRWKLSSFLLAKKSTLGGGGCK